MLGPRRLAGVASIAVVVGVVLLGANYVAGQWGRPGNDGLRAVPTGGPTAGWSPTISGLEPGTTLQPMLPEPDWAKTIRMVPLEARRDGPLTLRLADSVWQIGSVPAMGATQWDEYYVWTGMGPGSDPNQPVIGTYVMSAGSPDVVAQYDGEYPCPRDIGHLTITAVVGATVVFSSSGGQTGAFDLETHGWSFN